jgi:2-methylcitrate synthase
MAAEEKKGLYGVVAGTTTICSIEKGMGLTYRGYTIESLADNATFEDVAYLLLYGEPATQEAMT